MATDEDNGSSERPSLRYSQKLRLEQENLLMPRPPMCIRKILLAASGAFYRLDKCGRFRGRGKRFSLHRGRVGFYWCVLSPHCVLQLCCRTRCACDWARCTKSKVSCRDPNRFCSDAAPADNMRKAIEDWIIDSSPNICKMPSAARHAWKCWNVAPCCCNRHHVFIFAVGSASRAAATLSFLIFWMMLRHLLLICWTPLPSMEDPSWEFVRSLLVAAAILRHSGNAEVTLREFAIDVLERLLVPSDKSELWFTRW